VGQCSGMSHVWSRSIPHDSSIQITLDRYSHLMPGNEQEVARIFDRYLRTREDLA
jgi:hypothetical protein